MSHTPTPTVPCRRLRHRLLAVERAMRAAHSLLSADAVAPSMTEEQVVEQNALIAVRLTYCFPTVSSLAIYCRDPTMLASLTPH